MARLDLLHRWGLVTLCCGILAACGEEQPESAAPDGNSPSAQLAGGAPLAAEKDRSRGLLSTGEPRSELLGWLPPDSLLALRIPHIGGLKDALQATAIGQALRRLELGGLEETLAGHWQEMTTQLQQVFPGAARVPSILEDLEGEVVISLVHVYPMLLMGGGKQLPLSAALLVELGESARSVQQLVLETSTQLGGKQIAENEFLLELQDLRFEARFEDDRLCLRITPSAVQEPPLADWVALEPHQSFLATEVVHAAPMLRGEGIHTCFEAFVNIAPVWTMLANMGPPQVRKPLQTMQIDKLRGISMVSAVAGAGFHEVVTVHSVGRQDVLTGLFGGGELDPAWLKAISADAESAAVMYFDLSRTLELLQQRLPEEIGMQIDQSIAGLSTMLGLDARRDVLDNFGPHWAVAMKGSPLLEDFEFTLSIQVKDVERVRQLVDLLVSSMGLSRDRQVHRMAGGEYYSLPVPDGALDAGPAFTVQPCYALSTDGFLISSSRAALEKAMVATAAGGRLAPAAMRACADSLVDGTFMVSYQSTPAQARDLLAGLGQLQEAAPQFMAMPLPSAAVVQDFTSQLPDTTAVARTVSEGLRMETRSAVSMTSAGFLGAGMAIGASIALPNLLANRGSSREREVVNLLKTIAASQAEFQAATYVDQDGDGVGEFGYLAELTGQANLRGRGARVPAPLLNDSLVVIGRCVEHAGYLFRLDLSGRMGEPLPEFASGGAPRGVFPGTAEERFVVYAWPAHPGPNAQRVMVMDETGNLFVSENTPPTQGYFGRENPPAPDAAFLAPNSNADRGLRSVRRGQDGALWLREDW
jgi:hypothetical protein